MVKVIRQPRRANTLLPMTCSSFSSREYHPYHDVESLVRRFGRKPKTTDFRALDRRVKTLIDGDY